MVQGKTFLQAFPGQDTRINQQELYASGKEPRLPLYCTPTTVCCPTARLSPRRRGTSYLVRAKPSLWSQRSLLWCKAELEEVTYSLLQFSLRTVIITQEQTDQHSQPAPALPPEREWAHSALQIHSSALHYEVISLIGCCTFMHNSSHLAPFREHKLTPQPSWLQSRL